MWAGEPEHAPPVLLAARPASLDSRKNLFFNPFVEACVHVQRLSRSQFLYRKLDEDGTKIS